MENSLHKVGDFNHSTQRKLQLQVPLPTWARILRRRTTTPSGVNGVVPGGVLFVLIDMYIRKTQKCLIELKSLNFVIKDTKHTKEGG